MGLLTNPQTREKVSHMISRYNNKLCFLSYVAGLIYFMALAYRPLNAGVYFSENALLPGLVDADFYHDYGATGHTASLKEEVKKQREKPKEESMKIPTDWFVTRFREIGLDVYVQNYSFMYPERLLKGQVFTGQNVYGILRAPRAASTEAVVLSAPYRPLESPQDRTYAGLGLMLGMAKAFRRHTYWAKDIIFLVTEHEQIGMQAWLDAYHYTPNSYIFAGELPGRSGSIQAAINLEIAMETISRINIKMEGLNGQLPNLDLINTAVRLCRREGVPALIQKKLDHSRPESQEGFKHSLTTMLQMMWNQAPGTPTGNHGLFHRYHIEAITLQGVKMKASRKSMGFVEMGRIMEGIFRSLNNLLERFHQSFFFYLLPATDRYVSIGLYMPPFGLLVAPLLIKAIALWINYGIHKAEEAENEIEDSNENDSDAEKEPHTLNKPPVGESFNTMLSLMPTCVMAVFFGLGAFYSPRYFIETAQALRTEPQEGLLFGSLAVQLAVMIHPVLLARKASQKGQAGPDWQLLKCIALLALSVLLGAISVINISMAFFLAATWVPVTLIDRPSSSRIFNFLQYILLVVISPLGLLVAGSVLHHVFIDPVSDPSQLLLKAYESCQSSLLVSVIETYFYNNWTFSIATIALLTTWSLFWSLLWAKPY